MMSTTPIKALVVLVLVHFSPSVLAEATAEWADGNGNGLLAARAASTHHHRRTIDLGRSTRLHRSRRRRSTALPKPYGTDGAATTDEENIKLLETYVAHQSEVNTAWQKQANADILAGKTAVQFDAFEENYDGHPQQDHSKKKEKATQRPNESGDDENEEQCEVDTDTREPAGERGPTLVDKAREKAKKKADKEAHHNDTGASLDLKDQDGEHTDSATSVDKGQTKPKDEHKSEQNHDQGMSQSQPSKSALKNDAERQKEQQDEKQKQEQQRQEEEQKEKEEEQKQQQKQQKEKEQEKLKQEQEQQKKEKAQQKEKAAEAQKQKQKDEHQQSTLKPASGPLAQFLGQTFSGDMTYYDVGLDACGWTDKVEGHTVAVAQEWFDHFSGGDDNPNHNPICGKKIKIYKNGKEEHATITDICPPCTKGSIDMSQSLFEALENLDVGRCNVKWEFSNE